MPAAKKSLTPIVCKSGALPEWKSKFDHGDALLASIHRFT